MKKVLSLLLSLMMICLMAPALADTDLAGT